MSKDLLIDRIEVIVVGPETQRYAWAQGMPEQFMTNTMLKITTKGGLEGIAGAPSFSSYNFDRSVAETLRAMLPPMIGQSPLDREALWRRALDLTLPRAPQAHSLIDVSLWDLAAKAADLPLYRMLGGARSKILSYASTPLLASAGAYVDFVAQLREEGFSAIKFHCWCRLGPDMEMVHAVAKRFGGSGLNFMLDVEQRYDRGSALSAGKQLSELGYRWFEAPLDDFDLEGYRFLRQRVDVPIISAGNSITDIRMMEFAVRAGCWSDLRIDVMQSGGFTPARKVMGLAVAHGMTVELQCWGYTLTQAANLHLMLAYENCTYFEQPAPYPAFEYGSLNWIRTDKEGFVHAPQGAGLGVDMDWPAIEKATVMRYEVR
jgi:L-alanine-DL-glutamate epimerase-like enolase superfamily enzyme